MRISYYTRENGAVVIEESFIPLRKASCTGCEQCGWLDEYIKEDMSLGIHPLIDKKIDKGVYELFSIGEGEDTQLMFRYVGN